MRFLAIILLILAILLEVSITTLPLVFLVLLSLMIVMRNDWLFLVAFICGLLLDALSFRALGFSSIIFLTFLFIALLYQSKFEINTGYFAITMTFLGSLTFLLLAGFTHLIIVQSILASLIGLVLFKFIQIANAKLQYG